RQWASAQQDSRSAGRTPSGHDQPRRNGVRSHASYGHHFFPSESDFPTFSRLILTSVHLHQGAKRLPLRTIPLAPVARLYSPPLSDREPVSSVERHHGWGRVQMPSKVTTIVVVEDDASMSQAIGRVLLTAGFNVVQFTSAEATLDAHAAATASCLVLDIHLPGMSGLELYRQVIGSGKVVPVIFITARHEPAIREEAERLGGAGSYLPKPFSGRDLLDVVTQTLRSP